MNLAHKFRQVQSRSTDQGGSADMDAIEVRLERALFSDDVVARTAHRYTSDFFARIRVEDSLWVVNLAPKSDAACTDRLSERFETDALDECLRERIRAQTQDIHTALVEAALREMLSPDRPAQS